MYGCKLALVPDDPVEDIEIPVLAVLVVVVPAPARLALPAF
jgi:hypothetical protein